MVGVCVSDFRARVPDAGRIVDAKKEAHPRTVGTASVTIADVHPDRVDPAEDLNPGESATLGVQVTFNDESKTGKITTC